MKPLDLVFFGHFSIDRISYKGEVTEETFLGGGVTYGPLTAKAFDSRKEIGIVSVIGNDFKHEINEFLKEIGVDKRGIRQLESSTTSFKLTPNGNRRNICLRAKAPDLEFSQVPKDYFSGKTFMLSPICNEIHFEFVRLLNARVEGIIGLDVQGFIRSFDSEGYLSERKSQESIDLVYRIIDELDERLIFKASHYEAEIITGISDPFKSIKELCRNDAIIIITLGENGSLILQKNHKIIEIPAFQPNQIQDPTGAGDAYMASFLLEYSESEKRDLKHTGIVASAAVSFLLEEKGPHGVKPRKTVFKRIKEKKYLKFQNDNE